MKAKNIVWMGETKEEEKNLPKYLPTEVNVPNYLEIESLENEDDQCIIEWLEYKYGYKISNIDIE